VADTEEIRYRLAELKLKPVDLSNLDAKLVLVREIATDNAKELSGWGALVAAGSPDAFVKAYPTLKALRSSKHVIAAGRFSEKPTLTDLDGLPIDNSELNNLRTAQPGNSEVKLSESEISEIQKITAGSPSLTPSLKTRLIAAYKKMLLNRLTEYIKNDYRDPATYADKEQRVSAESTYAELARAQRRSTGICEHLGSVLESGVPSSQVQSFFYWAKESFGGLRRVINLVHVMIHTDGARTFIVSRQLYSSHYTEAALTLAEFIPFKDSSNQRRTLVIYTVRMALDMFGGGLGFAKRRVARPRVLATLKESLTRLRVSLEAPLLVSRIISPIPY
jgi:hypothetical protein